MLTYQLVPVLVDLSKLSEIVKTDVVEKYVYKAKIKNIENQIPDIMNLATNAFLNAKINDVKAEISNIVNLAMNTVLTAVEIIIPNVSNLVKKSDYNAKINEIENRIATDLGHDKHITTQKFNKLIKENFTARSKQVNLASKNDIDNFVKKTNLIID